MRRVSPVLSLQYQPTRCFYRIVCREELTAMGIPHLEYRELIFIFAEFFDFAKVTVATFGEPHTIRKRQVLLEES